MKKGFVVSKIKRGFTLVEVIVSIFILTVGVGGAFMVIRSLTEGANINNSRLTASFLGQEGVEIIRNIRDTNWLQDREDSSIEWDDGLSGGEWEVDYKTETLTSYTGDNLKIDGGFFNYSSGSDSPFKRKVTLTKLGSDSMKVNVTVEWEERGRTHEVEVTEIIQNWLK